MSSPTVTPTTAVTQTPTVTVTISRTPTITSSLYPACFGKYAIGWSWRERLCNNTSGVETTWRVTQTGYELQKKWRYEACTSLLPLTGIPMILVPFSSELKTEIITNDTTWRVPEGVTKLDVFLVGGGGQGGEGGAVALAGGSGGGGGGITYVTDYSVTPGTLIPITIGKGGSYVAGPDADSQIFSGTNTTFNTELIAQGGLGAKQFSKVYGFGGKGNFKNGGNGGSVSLSAQPGFFWDVTNTTYGGGGAFNRATDGRNGIVNTGQGGSGFSNNKNTGKGGSGIAIVRYIVNIVVIGTSTPTSTPTPTDSGTVTPTSTSTPTPTSTPTSTETSTSTNTYTPPAINQVPVPTYTPPTELPTTPPAPIDQTKLARYVNRQYGVN